MNKHRSEAEVTELIQGTQPPVVVLLDEEGEDSSTLCQICSTPLRGEHGGESNLRYGLCLEHLVMVEGGGKKEALAMLLSRGIILICYYSRINAYKIRVEARSNHRMELQMMKDAFGAGRVYKHAGLTKRWSAASLKDIHKVGSILMPILPAFGILLQTYVVQPDHKSRSAWAEAALQKLGARTIHLVNYL